MSKIIILFIALAVFVTAFEKCTNSVLDKEMNNISETAKQEYQNFNTEDWSDKVLGGNTMKKSVYVTYSSIAKENNISVFEAVQKSRGEFAGQLKAKFKTFSSFLALPTVRNATKSTYNNRNVVIVHYTYRKCETDEDNKEYCYTEHDEVTIPENE